jgi:hypothetical protein
MAPEYYRLYLPQSLTGLFRPAAGAKVVLLVTDNHASKLALRMAKALLRPRDELRVTTVVMSPESLPYGRKLTEEFCSSDTSGQLVPDVRHHQQQQKHN